MHKLSFKTWIESKESKIHDILHGQNLIFFFTKNGNLYGCPETSRVVFAKIKEPDEDTPAAFVQDADFAAFDLIKAIMGKRVENLFGFKDIKDINVISPEKAKKILLKSPEKDDKQIHLKIHHGQDGAGVIKLRDKK